MTTPATRAWRRWLPPQRWWPAYLVLLLLSAAFQGVVTIWPVWPTQSTADLDVGTVQTPVFDDEGELPGDPVTLGYQIAGPAEADLTLIALHGSPSFGPNFTVFAPRLIDAMAEQGLSIRVISPDLPGYGESDEWVPDYSCNAYAHYTLALMDELSIERAHVLGYSLGGGVATCMTDLAPHRMQSMIFFGGLGAQEVEGTGNHGFEHFKYGIAYAAFVIGPELAPHFGLLGDRAVRHAFVRNFWDTDQRPYGAMLARVSNTDPKLPVLLLQGNDDPLVLPEAGRYHHELIEQSELVVLDGGHGDIFFEAGVEPIVEEVADFLARTQASGYTPTRRTVDPFTPTADENAETAQLATSLKLKEQMNPWLKMAIIALATFISEDYTCISVGLLINHQHTDLFLGVIACFLGIFLGDIALFLTGRLAGTRVMKWGPIRKWAPTETLDELGNWYEKYGFVAVFASRFMPGTRTPLYITAGVVGGHSRKFVVWALISDILYTPLIVILVASFGDRLAGPLVGFFGKGWIAVLVAALIIFFVMRIVVSTLTRRGRQMLLVKLHKFGAQEFWPPKLFYLPMLPVWLWLTIKYRHPTVFTSVNPAIPDGGFVGESKAQILDHLPSDAVLPWVLLDAPEPAEHLGQVMQDRGWSFPVILKPDVGERGFGLKKANSIEDARGYLAEASGRVIAQTFDPGPYEAGVFYIRHPEQADGFIYSITDKVFPVITGDGQRTLEDLIWDHKRFRMQANVFLHRHHQDRQRVLGQGETLTLATAGNHCQGTLFQDGSHLNTPELTKRIDEIAKGFEGFYFGRFDVRYADPQAFKRGEDLKIIELNGVTSESTNIYDPTWPIWRTYRVLIGQWVHAYQIGSALSAQGVAPTGPMGLIKHWRQLRQGPKPVAIAD